MKESKTKVFKAKHTAETEVVLPADASMEDVIRAHQQALAENVAAVTTTNVKYTNAKMLADLRDCHARGIGAPAKGTPVVADPSAERQADPETEAVAASFRLAPKTPAVRDYAEKSGAPLVDAQPSEPAETEDLVGVPNLTEPADADAKEPEPVIDIDELYDKMMGCGDEASGE